MTLNGRVRSGSGTWVRVSGGSAGGTSLSISVRSGRSINGSFAGRTELGVRVRTVAILTVVEPSNDGGDTNVVLGTELTEKDSPVLAESVTWVVSGRSEMRWVGSSSDALASRARRLCRGDSGRVIDS